RPLAPTENYCALHPLTKISNIFKAKGSIMNKSFLEDDKVRSEMTLRRLIANLWPLIWSKRSPVVAVVSMVIFYTAMGRALPFLFGYAVDEGIKKSNMTVIYIVAGTYLTFEVLRALLGFAQSYLMEKIGNRVLFELREKLIHHVQKRSEEHTSELQSRENLVC